MTKHCVVCHTTLTEKEQEFCAKCDNFDTVEAYSRLVEAAESRAFLSQ